MRALTFKGFLAAYLEELSYAGTASINKLLKELDRNPRLKEPLILHGIFSGMPMQVRKRAPEIFQEYKKIQEIIEDKDQIIGKKEELPENYRKVLITYEYRRNKVDYDNHTKLLMRERILRLQEEKNISTYRIYRELKLNPGNVNYFLKNGDASKLRLNTVREIWDFVKRY